AGIARTNREGNTVKPEEAGAFCEALCSGSCATARSVRAHTAQEKFFAVVELIYSDRHIARDGRGRRRSGQHSRGVCGSDFATQETYGQIAQGPRVEAQARTTCTFAGRKPGIVIRVPQAGF